MASNSSTKERNERLSVSAKSSAQKSRSIPLRKKTKMKQCTICSGPMEELDGKTPEGIAYHYYKCTNCGEEIVAMEQLHAVADTYRSLKQYHVKLTKWGLSLGLRIPKELVEQYNFKEEDEVSIIPDKKGIKIIRV